MEQFTIDFTYDGLLYKGMVIAEVKDGTLEYTVRLESENQESSLEILAHPPGSGKDYWVFKCMDDQEPPERYDQQLLEEIGEAIEKQQANTP